MPFLLLLKQAWERRDLILVLALVFFVALSKRQHETITALHARPTVEFRDRIVEKRVLVRGPVRIVKDVVKAPDGTVTTRTTTDKAPETVSTDKAKEVDRIETPPKLPDAPRLSRYVGVALDPFDHGMPKRARVGLTLWQRVDAGVAWEPRRSPHDGSVQLEITYRF